MSFHFKYKVNALDLWQLSMYGIYHTMIGMCNIVFTLSMIVLAVSFWGKVNAGVNGLLVALICVFTVIQPAVIYCRAKKQASKMPQDMEMTFDEQGIHIKAQAARSDVKWQEVKGLSKMPAQLVIMCSKSQGFVVPYKVLGEDKERVCTYIQAKIK